ncbi:MAG: hypothetical protein J3Q66DRAFT_398912 [Benniella sp.]|nr:MAG: hypothetical protein J3Q66DRAFT_398912 [Benniella sp.]
MKFTTIVAAIAAVVLCSNVEAYKDKKCYDQDMRLSKLQVIQCDRYQIKNTCHHGAKILQPTAGDWIRDLSKDGVPKEMGCFEAIKGQQDPKCYREHMTLAPSENIICLQYDIKNTCKTKKTIKQPEANYWYKDLQNYGKPLTKGCFKATKLYSE